MILLPNSSANIVLKRDASNNVIYGATGTDDTTDKLVYARGITSTISNAAPTTNNNWSCTINYPVADGKWIHCGDPSGNYAWGNSSVYFPPLPGYYEMCFKHICWTAGLTNYWYLQSLSADSYIYAPSDIWAASFSMWNIANAATYGWAISNTVAACGYYGEYLAAMVTNVNEASISTITDPSPIITTPTQSSVPSPSSPLTVTPSITSSYSSSTSGSVNCYSNGGLIVQYVQCPYGANVGQGVGGFVGTAQQVSGTYHWSGRDQALEGQTGWFTVPYTQYASSGIVIRVCCPYNISGGRSTTTTFSGTSTVTRNNGDGSSFSASGSFGNNGTIALTQTS